MLRAPPVAATHRDLGNSWERLELAFCRYATLSCGLSEGGAVAVSDGNEAKYAADLGPPRVEAQVSQLGLSSAEILFAMGLGITVGKEFFVIEGVSFTSAAGLACVYRVLLREAATQSY